MTAALHPEIDQVIQSPTAEQALKLATLAASAPSGAWTEKAWLSVAAGANSAASSDARWLAVCIFAHERRSADVAVVDALVKRARFMLVAGPDPKDQFRDPDTFFGGVRRFIGVDSSQAALRTFEHASGVVFSADRRSPEWAAARLQFI